MDKLTPNLQVLLQQDPPKKKDILNYIEENIEAIKNRLKEKIEQSPYCLNGIMEPSDVVEIDSGSDQGKLDPTFEKGQKALKEGNYEVRPKS